jgi:hypothetical protein
MIQIEIKPDWHPIYPDGGYVQLKSVTDACKVLDISRTQFYREIEKDDPRWALIEKEAVPTLSSQVNRLTNIIEKQISQNREIQKKINEIMIGEIQEKINVLENIQEPKFIQKQNEILNCDLYALIAKKMAGFSFPLYIGNAKGGKSAWGKNDEFPDISLDEKIKSEEIILATWNSHMHNHPVIGKLEIVLSSKYEYAEVFIYLNDPYKKLIQTCSEAFYKNSPLELVRNELEIYTKLVGLGLHPHTQPSKGQFARSFRFNTTNSVSDKAFGYNGFEEFLDNLEKYFEVKLIQEWELMDISTHELVKMCLLMNIPIPAEGKNTHQKIRNLLVGLQKPKDWDSLILKQIYSKCPSCNDVFNYWEAIRFDANRPAAVPETGKKILAEYSCSGCGIMLQVSI